MTKEDINVPQISSGDKSGKLLLKKGERCYSEREREGERERERDATLSLLVCEVGGTDASL